MDEACTWACIRELVAGAVRTTAATCHQGTTRHVSAAIFTLLVLTEICSRTASVLLVLSGTTTRRHAIGQHIPPVTRTFRCVRVDKEAKRRRVDKEAKRRRAAI